MFYSKNSSWLSSFEPDESPWPVGRTSGTVTVTGGALGRTSGTVTVIVESPFVTLWTTGAIFRVPLFFFVFRIFLVEFSFSCC